jgi:hypothetical protein
MSARIASGVLASALIRRVQGEGGNAAVMARGDKEAGAILILACERGADTRFFERGIGPDGAPALVQSGPLAPDPLEVIEYWQRRRARDPDLWVIELDIAGAERFAAETMLGG